MTTPEGDRTMTDTLASDGSLRELAYRRSGGLDVTLYWNADENRTSVELFHAATEQMFRFSVERERALYAFEHPFAYLQTLPVDAVLVAESV
jgi:hypothetical protein